MNRLIRDVLTGVSALGLMAITTAVFGQDIYSPGSSIANSMIRGANLPANHFTGIPDITIPLFELPGKELSVPIALSYHAGGHKVNEQASWVGLGWSLQAGGVITRVVRGIPDEVANGYCGSNHRGSLTSSLSPTTATYDYLGNVQSRTWDGQPDEFHFSVMGISGTFVLDENGVAYTIPSSNIKIEPGICSGTEWVITDEAGTRYIFSNDEESTVSYMDNELSSHKTAWYVTRIESANKTDEITFTYQTGGDEKVRYVQDAAYEQVMGTGCVKLASNFSINEFITTSTKVVQTITSSLGSIAFIQSPNKRLDLPTGKRLSRIEVSDHLGNLIESFWLNHGYFYADNVTLHDENTRRLKLESVYREGHLLASFDYNEAVNLPSKESNSTDHWGFYGNDFSGFPAFDHPVFGHFSGADRSTSSQKVVANLITKIVYGSGSSVQYTFEANQYYDSQAGSNKYAGGARVAQVVTNPGNGQESQTTTYEYKDFSNSSRSSGILYAEPLYYEGIVTGETGNTAEDVTIKRYLQPIGFLTGMQGIRVGYSNVKVTTGLGKIKYTYRDLNVQAPRFPLLFQKSGLNVILRDEVFSEIMTVSVPFTQGWGGGLLEKKEILKTDETPVLTEIFEYDFDTDIVKSIYGVVSERRHFNNCIMWGYVADRYAFFSRPFFLTKRKLIQYDPANVSRKTTNITDYNYVAEDNGIGGINFLLRSSTSYNEALPGLKYITNYKYPIDYFALLSSDPVIKGYYRLWQKNICTTPVETYLVVDDNGTQTLNGVSYQTYLQTGTTGQEKVFPHKSYRNMVRIPASSYVPSHLSSTSFVPGNVTFELVRTLNFTESTGLLSSMSDFHGSQSSFTYDTKGRLTNRSVSNDLLASSVSLVPSTFTGPTSTTDQNGRMTAFTYDKSERLSTVSDDDNNVITRKTYVSGNTVALLVEGPESSSKDSPATFYASDPFDKGVTTFSWNMGDGSTYSTTNKSVTHTYTNPGVEVIKVTASNNEAGYTVVGERGVRIWSAENPLTVGQIIPTFISTSDCATTMTFSTTASGGCSTNYTYTWQWQVNGKGWNTFDPSVATGFSHLHNTVLEIKATASTDCGETASNIYETYFADCSSNPIDY